ncbi:hypothetical protein bpuSUM_001289 (plasmid) [Borrelia puertoricensis]|nr:hypothetical protein bpuSUM_000954 [Borrelia puertoricensis]UPA18642.1 hypothetical protein bpuSUM_001121 [Borrelia puertoricensis]UPA18800.1 hypothetical protein bpuSUM_001289 [Borrelia puertoricensis]
MNRLFKVIFICAITLIMNCTTIASLTKEPTMPDDSNLESISKYESELSKYVLYLQGFLVDAKKKMKNKDFPKFSFFDASKLKSEHTIKALNFNISLLQEYISQTKPIAEDVYKRYTKLK